MIRNNNLFYVNTNFARESEQFPRFTAWIDAKTARKYCVEIRNDTVHTPQYFWEHVVLFRCSSVSILLKELRGASF